MIIEIQKYILCYIYYNNFRDYIQKAFSTIFYRADIGTFHHNALIYVFFGTSLRFCVALSEYLRDLSPTLNAICAYPVRESSFSWASIPGFVMISSRTPSSKVRKSLHFPGHLHTTQRARSSCLLSYNVEFQFIFQDFLFFYFSCSC